MKKAFISHATADDKFVVELKGLILGLGYESVFNDADYDSIAPDQEFWPRIVDGIQAADAFVVVVSEQSGRSVWMKKEVEYARDQKKRVLPILIEDCALPELFRDRDVIDFRRGHRNPLSSEDSRPLRAYLARLIEILDRKQGVLSYLPRTGRVDDATADEFGYSVLVEEESGGSESTLPLSEAIERHRAVVITGDPGAGKSTALRQMARVMAADFDRADGNGSVPILLDLTRWPAEKGLDDAIEDAFQGIPNILETLQKRNHSVFLDGLNEVSDKETVDAIVSSVRQAARRAGPIGLQHLIITCRKLDYLSGDDSLKTRLDLPSITISALEKEEIRAFCSNYLPSSASNMIHIIAQNNLWSLASNAYMLCALITIYKHRGADAFPTNAADLFPALTKALCQRERKRGYSGDLTYSELTDRLAEVAHWVTLEHGFGEFDLTELPEKLDPQRTVSGLSLRCGLLNGADDHMRFNHQLTQEYFNAVWFKATDLTAPIRNGNFLHTGRFGNSFRILGGMKAQYLGVKLFRIDPSSLVEWVRDGVYTSEAYAELVMDLMELAPSDYDYNGKEFDALNEVVRHDRHSSALVLIKYLEREPVNMSPRSIVIALSAIQTLSPKAERNVLQLLDDERCYSRYRSHTEYHTVAPTSQIRIRELAAEAIFRVGQEEALASAIEHVRTWLNDSTIVEVDSGFSGIGSESNHERFGNRAFNYLVNGPAQRSPQLRQELRKWLEQQEGAEGMANVQEYDYLGTNEKITTSQAEWAKSMLRKWD